MPRAVWNAIHADPLEVGEHEDANATRCGDPGRYLTRADPTLGVCFVLDRDLCRDALPLDHYGETVILIHDPFDVTDQVVRHDGELKRIVPHQSKLGNRDVDARSHVPRAHSQTMASR
jgi:hypothetical protein